MALEQSAGVAKLSYLDPGVATFQPTDSGFAEHLENINARKSAERIARDKADAEQKKANREILKEFPAEHWAQHTKYFQKENDQLYDAANKIIANKGNLNDYGNPVVAEWHKQANRIKSEAAASKQIEAMHDSYATLASDNEAYLNMSGESRREMEEFLYGYTFEGKLRRMQEGGLPTLQPMPDMPIDVVNDTLLRYNNKAGKAMYDTPENIEKWNEQNREELRQVLDVQVRPVLDERNGTDEAGKKKTQEQLDAWVLQYQENFEDLKAKKDDEMKLEALAIQRMMANANISDKEARRRFDQEGVTVGKMKYPRDAYIKDGEDWKSAMNSEDPAQIAEALKLLENIPMSGGSSASGGANMVQWSLVPGSTTEVQYHQTFVASNGLRAVNPTPTKVNIADLDIDRYKDGIDNWGRLWKDENNYYGVDPASVAGGTTPPLNANTSGGMNPP